MQTYAASLGTAVGYQQLTVSTTAVGLTVPALARICTVIVETNAVRWRDDGTNPTASVGNPMVANADMRYDGDLSKIRFIRQSADATVNINYYR